MITFDVNRKLPTCGGAQEFIIFEVHISWLNSNMSKCSTSFELNENMSPKHLAECLEVASKSIKRSL